MCRIPFSPHAKALAEDMYRALWSSVIGITVTIGVSMFTKPKTHAELEGLVYGIAHWPREKHPTLFGRPVFWGALAMALLAILQWIFW